MSELRDADLLHSITGAFERLLQGLVGAALPQPLHEAVLALRHVEKLLFVGGDQDEAELRRGLQVRDVSVEKAFGVELRQADGSPALALPEGRGGADEVQEQVQVYVMQKLVFLPDKGDQAVAGQQDGEHQVFVFGGLEAGWDHVPGRAGQGQAGDRAEQQPGVLLQAVHQVVYEVLGAGQQAAQVVVLLVLEDVVELGKCEQADDLIVDVMKFSLQLLVWLTGLRHAHQDQRTLVEEDHFTTI